VKAEKILKKRVLILGAGGMLGAEVVAKCAGLKGIEIFPAYRGDLQIDILGKYRRNFRKLVSDFRPDYVVNCVGLNKRENSLRGIFQQLVINGIFPRYVSKQTRHYGYFMIHVSSDGVFFGKTGFYSESSRRCPRTIYALSKILGENVSNSALIIRCSIFGKNKDTSKHQSLFSWFQSLKPGSPIIGYTNHRWNGVSVDYLARLIAGLVLSDYKVGGIQHFVPSNVLSKYELLDLFRNVTGRRDISITPILAKIGLNRELTTQYPETNRQFWKLTGLIEVPTISELVGWTFTEGSRN